MKRLGKMALCLAGGLALNAGLHAASPAATNHPASVNHPASANHPVTAVPAPASIPVSANNVSLDNPYAAIVTRNIFGLNPPAPPAPPEDPAKDLPKITPTGIMGVFGNYQVLFKVAPLAAVKPGPAAKEEFYILSEGQRQDDIEVVKIDDKNSLVTFDNHGITQELPLASASASGGAGTSSPGGGNPGTAPGMPGGGGNRGAGGFTTFGAGPGVNNGGIPSSNPGSNGGGPNGANGGLGFGGSTEGRVYQPEASILTPEAVQINVAGNHLKAIQENDPTAPIFPPTVIDKEAGIPDNTMDSGSSGPPVPH